MAYKILIVEDNEKNRTLIRDLLLYHGYQVIEAEDGAAGIAMAKEQKPDLILMDIRMPVLDGIIAARTIKSDPDAKGARIIAITSFAMKGDREKIMSSGFDDYLAKPIDTRKLSELVRKLVQSAA